MYFKIKQTIFYTEKEIYLHFKGASQVEMKCGFCLLLDEVLNFKQKYK